MGKYILVAMTNPVEGKDKEYNTWYDNHHLSDLLRVSGITSAQRFKLKNAMGSSHTNNYMAIYEIETDDLDLTLKDLFSRHGTSAMVSTDALDMGVAVSGVFEACSPLVHREKEG